MLNMSVFMNLIFDINKIAKHQMILSIIHICNS